MSLIQLSVDRPINQNMFLDLKPYFPLSHNNYFASK